MIKARNIQLEEIKTLLDEEIESYSEIEDKMRLKKRHIIEGNVEALLNLDQDLLNLGQKVTTLEQKRLTLMVQMGYENKTLQEFIDCLDAAQGGSDIRAFTEARSKLLRVVDNIRALNDNHRSLLDLSLKWISDSVAVIADLLVPEAASYTASGGKATNRPVRSKDPFQGTSIQSTVEHSA